MPSSRLEVGANPGSRHDIVTIDALQGPITDGWQGCSTPSVFVYTNCSSGQDTIAAFDLCGTLVRFGGAVV